MTYTRLFALLIVCTTGCVEGRLPSDPMDVVMGGSDATLQMDVPSETDAASQTDARTDTSVADVGEAVVDDEVTMLCETTVERRDACGRSPQTVDECLDDAMCAADFLRRDALVAIARCENERPCGASDDNCFDASHLGITPSASAAEFATECRERHAQCGFGGDECGSSSFATDERIGRASACLMMACDGMRGCVRDALTRCD